MSPTGIPTKQAVCDLSDDDIVGLIDTLQPDDGARLMRALPSRRRGTIRARIANAHRDEILTLSDYPETVAGGLMNSHYADLAADTRCSDAVRQLAAEDHAETIYIAYVVDADRRLLGSVSLRDLLRAPKDTTVGEVMEHDVTAVPVVMPAEDASRLLSRSGRAFLPVVDDYGRLVGTLSFNDAFARLEEEAAEDMQRFTAIAGSGDARYFDVSLWSDFLRRAPWILSLAIVGLMAGYIVHVYEDALDALVILALYMPMVADTGGNVGTQTSGLLIRAIATGEVSLGRSAAVFWREARIGLMLAAMLFAFALLKVTFLSNNADVPLDLTLHMIALAIGIAIAVQVLVSALIGAGLPLAALVVRQDPAVMAGPALTTVVDVTGLLMYFMITTAILGI
jgi:magnesium transporter